MEQFIDGDLASNDGGWQWSASTGTDAQVRFSTACRGYDLTYVLMPAILPHIQSILAELEGRTRNRRTVI